ncbi:steroid delta-isomerase [Heyndrickxia shackletonii]|uniref:Steroid delta-isomerase n=1 Tax=Heyndrickxia shackletonii TaxID=157838 RepID=A0A0Q3TEP9_9BACI|nr:steroid Delta-isomerase [Heyndrickxia shackletonii]KQL52534.1 steroid delta-isomerase [Heyndrickxia shackletonii]
MESSVMKKALQEYVDAFNQKDLERLISLFADDASVEDPVGKPLKKGRQEIEEFYRESMSGESKLELLAPPRGSFSNAASITFAVHTKMEGRSARIEVTDVMTFNNDGKISTMQAFWGPDDLRMV